MRCLFPSVALMLLVLATNANAAAISFVTDPFAGSDALTTPGRQIVGGEPFIDFDIASDVFVFDPRFFDVSAIDFVNAAASDIPAGGVNTIVLRTFDNDADPVTPFGAGLAANLIAAQITSFTPGFFIYFNSGLDLPRLVYSTDLSDPAADLKILARMTNLPGQGGRDALATFTAGNFALRQVPEPSSALLLMLGLGLTAARARRRRVTRGESHV